MGMEIEPKNLHRPAIQIVLGMISIVAVFSLATSFTDTTIKYASGLNKNVIEIKSSPNKYGLLTIQVKQQKAETNLDEIGQGADYYFKFN